MLLAGVIKEIPKSQVWKDILVEQSKWFYVDSNQAYNVLNFCFNDYDQAKSKALELMS